MQKQDELKVAVVTGHHSFDLPAFQRMWRELPGIDAYPQSLGDFAADEGKVRDWYDVIAFYNFHQETPGTRKEQWWERGAKTTLERIGETEQGIVVLHHALLAFPAWPLWSDIVGIQDRSFGYHHGQDVHIEVVNSDHPITQGVSAWDMVDETYTMNDAGHDSEILLVTDHPKSMRTIAWTHIHKKARIFCFESGHDALAYDDPNFRTVLTRGIHWAARKI